MLLVFKGRRMGVEHEVRVDRRSGAAELQESGYRSVTAEVMGIRISQEKSKKKKWTKDRHSANAYI